MTTRSLTPSISAVAEELELRQPSVVTKELIQQICNQLKLGLPADAVAERLVRQGWLLPLRTRASWEFAPAARAGPYRSGDPWIELRALLAHNPDAPVAVAFESAFWDLGHSSRQPATPVLAHRPGWRPPRSIDARTVTFEWRQPTQLRGGLPVWTEPTAVVAASARPSAQGDWANADEWLPDTFAVVSSADVLDEARGRSASALARLCYLAEWSGRGDIAEQVSELLPPRLPVSFLGPRGSRSRWSKRWRVYDAVLPAR